MARTLIVTIRFCDLVASTERRTRLGDKWHAAGKTETRTLAEA